MSNTTLIVDAANVMGSRPDGWWSDRAGAGRRLRDQLAGADLPYDRIILVLEGATKRGAQEGTEGKLTIVHAPGEGDDEIVNQAKAAAADSETTVVTADRGLRARIDAVGATCVGPGWLLARLPSTSKSKG